MEATFFFENGSFQSLPIIRLPSDIPSDRRTGAALSMQVISDCMLIFTSKFEMGIQSEAQNASPDGQ